MTGRRLLVALSTAVLTIALAPPAGAQTKTPPAGKGQEARVEAKRSEGKKPVARKVVRLEEMRVEGRVQKPQAMFLMPRASVNPGTEQDRAESFLPKAKDAVERDPF